MRHTRILVFVFALVALPFAETAGALPLSVYGVDSSCNCLYVVDVDTNRNATVTQIGSGLGFGLVASLATDIDGALFAVSNTGGGASQGELIRIDTATGVGTSLGTGVGVVGGLAITPVSVPGPTTTWPAGTLFGTRSVTASTDELIVIDKTNASVTVVGSTGMRISGLAFRADGTLFAGELDAMSSNDRLLSLSTATGASTIIGTLSPSVDIVGALLFNPNGELLGSDAATTSARLFLIDQKTAQVSEVIALSNAIPQGLAWESGTLTSVVPVSWGRMKRVYW